MLCPHCYKNPRPRIKQGHFCPSTAATADELQVAEPQCTSTSSTNLTSSTHCSLSGPPADLWSRAPAHKCVKSPANGPTSATGCSHISRSSFARSSAPSCHVSNPGVSANCSGREPATTAARKTNYPVSSGSGDFIRATIYHHCRRNRPDSSVSILSSLPWLRRLHISKEIS
jgi:hypothetical protein